MNTSATTVRLHRAKRPFGIAIVWSAAIVMGAVELEHVFEMSSVGGIVGFALLPFCFNLGLFGAGYVLWRRQFEGDEVLRIVAWMLFGVVLLALLTAWTIAHQNVRGRPFAHGSFVLVNNVSAGSLIGFTLGWYDVRGRRDRRTVETERTKLEFLNRLLRHNVLNGMQIITGYATFLENDVDEAGRERLATISNRSEEIVRLIQGVQGLTTSGLEGTDALETRNLRDVLARQVRAADRAYETARFSLDASEDAFVRADELLPDLFDNLLTNAVKHNDSAVPEVTVSATSTGDSVRVRIADNGPGVPEEISGAVLDWNVKGESSAGSGIGLAIVDTLVERYDGTLRIEDNDPKGTVVAVELPTAQPEDAASR